MGPCLDSFSTANTRNERAIHQIRSAFGRHVARRPVHADSHDYHRYVSSGSKEHPDILTYYVGGTFILAFLIYALWRRRKGATYSEIIHFRPHSSTLILSPGPRNPDFTALPIYRESRYSVRSTKRGSWLSFGKLMQIRAPSPSSEAFSKGQWLHAQWKSATPPTPTRAGHPLSHVQNASAPAVSTPEMAHARANSQTERIRIKRAASESNISKPLPTVSAREVAASPDVEDLDAGEPPDTPRSDKQLPDDSCWSWTNSQAPATPRMRTRSLTRRPSGASIRSLSSFHKVHSWLKPQTERAVNQIPEEQAPRPAPKPKLPPLKNKASKPILAPINTKPTRRLSKKSGPPSVASNRSRARSVGR